jgi:hypothetical protein
LMILAPDVPQSQWNSIGEIIELPLNIEAYCYNYLRTKIINKIYGRLFW